MHTMFEAVMDGARNDAIDDVEVSAKAALAATAVDVLEADGYLLGTPANLGYISGALKHFFDQIYYPCLDETAGRPYAVYLHGNSDTTGAARAIETITTGLQWKLVQKPLTVVGELTNDDRDACWELGAAMAAGLSTQ